MSPVLPTLPTLRPSVPPQRAGRQIEDYPDGYPRFAAATAAHHSFFCCRRFSAVRARMLLYKQDRISQLEAELEQIDDAEPKVLFHGSHRRDSNPQRIAVLAKLDIALAEYDDLTERTYRTLGYHHTTARNVQNLQGWLNACGSISRDESAYLGSNDLMALGPSEADESLETIAGIVEDALIVLSRWTGRDLRTGASRDPAMHIFPAELIKTLTGAILAILASATLLIPIAILTFVHGVAVRLTIVLGADVVLILLLSLVTKTRVNELFMAGAAYAAVLVVYISGTN